MYIYIHTHTVGKQIFGPLLSLYINNADKRTSEKSYELTCILMSEISIWPLRKTWLMTHFPSSGTGQNSTVRYDTRLNTLIQLTFPLLTVPLLDRRVEVCAGLFFFVPLLQGYILLPATPTIYSLFVHLLSALNNFLPDPTVPQKNVGLVSKISHLNFHYWKKEIG